MTIKPSTRYRLDFDAPAAVDFDHFIVETGPLGTTAKVLDAPGQKWAWEGRVIPAETIKIGGCIAFMSGDGRGRFSYLNYPTTAITAQEGP